MSSPRLTVDGPALKRISLFAGIDDEKLQQVARACRHRSYPRGATILDVGTVADGVYALLAGRAKLIIEDRSGREMTLGMLEPNDLFGEQCVFEEIESAVRVEALTNCEALYVPKRAFIDCIAGNYDAALLLFRSALERLSRADRKIASLGLLNVYARVATLMIESAQCIDGVWVVATGSEEIARTVGASREMVSRVMRQMKAEGLVRRVKRTTVILERTLLLAALAPAVPGRTRPGGMSVPGLDAERPQPCRPATRARRRHPESPAYAPGIVSRSAAGMDPVNKG